jgi:hypothetical protein
MNRRLNWHEWSDLHLLIYSTCRLGLVVKKKGVSGTVDRLVLNTDDLVFEDWSRMLYRFNNLTGRLVSSGLKRVVHFSIIIVLSIFFKLHTNLLIICIWSPLYYQLLLYVGLIWFNTEWERLSHSVLFILFLRKSNRSNINLTKKAPFTFSEYNIVGFV